MRDLEARVRSGSPLVIPARTWNDLMEMLRLYKRKKFSIGGMLESSLIQSKLTMLLRNGIGTDLPIYSVLRIGGTVLDPSDDPHDTNRRPSCYGYLPAGSADPFAITQAPVYSNEIVGAMFSGIGVCRVFVHDFAHEWANPVDGVTRYLESAECGQARILDLWPDAESGIGGGASGGSGVNNILMGLVHLIGAVPCVQQSGGSGSSPGSTPANPDPGTSCTSGGSFSFGDLLDGNGNPGEFYHRPASPGAYKLNVTMSDAGTGTWPKVIVRSFPNADCTGTETIVLNVSPSNGVPSCYNVTLPAGTQCVCVHFFTVFAVGAGGTYSATLQSGSC